MPPGPSPVFRRKRLGDELRALREAKGFKLAQLAGELGWSHTKLSRLENAKVRPDLADIMDALDVLGADEAVQRRLVTLARLANQRGWWKAYSEMPQRQAGLAELEAGAARICEYSSVLVPGLLQTPDYMRARFADHGAFKSFDVEEAVAGRLERQRVLSREHPVDYLAVLDEAVLRRHSAPPAVFAAQLSALIQTLERPNVTVRVLPFAADLPHHATALNTFALFQFADVEDDDLVSIETETSELQLGDAEDLARYTVVLDRIASAALDPAASARLIQSVRDELTEESASP